MPAQPMSRSVCSATMSVYSAPAAMVKESVTPAAAFVGDTRAAVPATRLPAASATPTATPSVLLLLSGTATMQPPPFVAPAVELR